MTRTYAPLAAAVALSIAALATAVQSASIAPTPMESTQETTPLDGSYDPRAVIAP